MWIVRLALRRPYTFVVASLLLLLLTPFVLLRTPTDIFPSINIPVVSVVWQYTGLTARDIEQRMVYTEERALTTTVNNIQHIESTSYDGVGSGFDVLDVVDCGREGAFLGINHALLDIPCREARILPNDAHYRDVDGREDVRWRAQQNKRCQQQEQQRRNHKRVRST